MLKHSAVLTRRSNSFSRHLVLRSVKYKKQASFGDALLMASRETYEITFVLLFVRQTRGTVLRKTCSYQLDCLTHALSHQFPSLLPLHQRIKEQTEVRSPRGHWASSAQPNGAGVLTLHK